jgi:uncharacterized HAD superfamily protein
MKKRIAKPKAVVIDLDGVIGDFLFTLTWLHNKLYGTSVSHNDIKTYNFIDLKITDVRGTTVTGDQLHSTFKEWEPHGIYSTMPLLPHAKEALVVLKKALGYKIILMTAREIQFKKQTELWLHKNDLPYDELIFEHDKAKKIRSLSKTYNIQAFMDDHVENVRSVAENTNVNNVFLIESPITRDREFDAEDFDKVFDLFEATRYLKEVK